MASRIADTAIDIVQREHAGHLASFDMGVWSRLRLAYQLVSDAEDEVDRLWGVDPRAAVTTVAPLRRCAVSRIK